MFLGMRIKSGFSAANVLAIPFIVSLPPIGGYYAVISLIFLLQDPAYFNIPNTEVSTVANDLIFWSMIFQIFGNLIIGYVFDLLGEGSLYSLQL